MYDLETICHRTPFLWANIPIDIKRSTSLSNFKREKVFKDKKLEM